MVRASSLLILAAFSSKLLGLLREVLVAKYLGVSSEFDLYLIALTIPTAIIGVIRYALPNAIILSFANYRLKDGDEYAWKSIWKLGNLWNLVVCIVTLGIVLAAPLIIDLLAPDLATTRREQGIFLMRVSSPMIFFTGLGIYWESLLNADHRFFLSALAPVLYSLVVIVSLFSFGRQLGVNSLVLGVLIATLAQNAVMAVIVIQKRSTYTAAIDLKIPGFFSFLRDFGFILIVELLGQSVALIDRSVAIRFGFPTGIISALNYANLLNQLPIAIFVLTIGQVIFPAASECSIKNDMVGFVRILSKGVRTIIYIIFPIGVIMTVFSDPIVRMVFQRGAFDEGAVQLTAICLSDLSIGLVFASILSIMMRIFYSLGKAASLVKIMSVIVLLKLLIAVSLAPILAYRALPVSTSLSWGIGVGIVVIVLRKYVGRIDGRKMVVALGKTAIGSVTMGFAAWITFQYLTNVFPGSLYALGGSLAGASAVGIVIFIFVTMAVHAEELSFMKNLVLEKVQHLFEK